MTSRKALALLSPLLLCGCVYQSVPAPGPLQPLAEDPREPALALLEHVLTGYFAKAGPDAPTTCAGLAPTALTAEQEEALIIRLVRVAPASRCTMRAGELVDSITGLPAYNVQVEDFACAEADSCSGRVARPGGAPARYVLRFENGAWRFNQDEGQGGA